MIPTEPTRPNQGERGRERDRESLHSRESSSDSEGRNRDSSFQRMMDESYRLFPDMMGDKEYNVGEAKPPGYEELQEEERHRFQFHKLKKADPIIEVYGIVDKMREEKAKVGKPSVLKFSNKKRSRFYLLSDEPTKSQHAFVNTKCKDFVPKTDTKGLKISIPESELKDLEEFIRVQIGILNFMFWVCGTVIKMVAYQESRGNVEKAKQGFHSLHRAMRDAATNTMIALNNIIAWRREAFVRTLPSMFSEADKRELVDSSFNLPSLFDDAKLTKVEDAVQKRLQREAEKRRSGGHSNYKSSNEKQYSRDKRSSKSSYTFSKGKDKKDRRSTYKNSRPSSSASKKKQG